MVPLGCSRQQSWQGAPSELPRGSTTPFQLHFDPQYIFGVEITLRVDTGQVALCYSTKKVPEQFGVTPAPLFDHPFARNHGTFATNIVVHQADGVPASPPPTPTPPQTPVVVPGSEVDGEHCTFGVSSYKVLTVPYARLAPNRRQKRENTPPTSAFIGLKGTLGFSRFQLLARPLTFEGVSRTTLTRDKTAQGPHTTGVVSGSVVARKYTFYEVPLGRLGLADLEIRLTATAPPSPDGRPQSPGCLSLYSSWDEIWPSPLRATASSRGYERSIQTVGTDCVTGDDSEPAGTDAAAVWTAIQPLTDELRRTLSIGIVGRQTQAGEPYDSDFQLEVIRHDYDGFRIPQRLLEGTTAAGSLQTAASAARVLGQGKLDFLELHAASNVALVSIAVRVGQVELLCATAGLPTRGRFAKRWTLSASSTESTGSGHAQHNLLVDISRDCGMPHNTSDTEPYFWSESDVSKEDELRQRVSLRGHVSGANGERSSVYLSVLGVAGDFGVGTEGNVYEMVVATEEEARVAAAG